jgi:histidine triad (HIT) family protein
MTDCLFCKFISKEINTNIVYEDKNVFAFKDINPQAEVHTLIIPKKHISTLNDLTMDDAALVGQLFLAAKKIANDNKVAESGYRTVINCNAHAGQTVFHVHLHLLGGRHFSWPPG